MTISQADLDLDFIYEKIIRVDIIQLEELPRGNIVLGPHGATRHDVQAQVTADLLRM
jgi:hypothetical protein